MAAAAVKEKPAPAASPEKAVALCVTVNRTDLLRALAFASAIVERRNTIPVLSNVLLSAEGETLRITATDLNLQLALTVPCEVIAEGATTVSSALFLGIVRELADGCQIELKIDGGRLQVNSGRSRYKVQTLPPDQFPILKDAGGGGAFTLSAAALIGAIGKVAFAQDTDTTVRPQYCGVNVEAADGELVFVATDGKRIAWSKLPAPEGVAIDSAILPTKLASSLTKLLDGYEGDVSLAFHDRTVKAEFDGTTLYGKLIEGSYPPWRRILPQGEGKRLLVSAESLATAIRRASAVALERTRAVKIELSTDKMIVSARSPNEETAVEEAPCIWSEADHTLGFNSRFVLDLLSACGADELQVDFFEGNNPLAVFANPNDASAQWLVAPMHV